MMIYFLMLAIVVYGLIWREGVDFSLITIESGSVNQNQCPRCGGTKLARGRLSASGTIRFEYEGGSKAVKEDSSLCLDCGSIITSIDIERLFGTENDF